MAIGAEVDLVSYLAAKYFGMKHYGRIFGMLYSLLVLGAAISPILVGFSWDLTGNYNAAFLGAAIATFLSLFIFLSLPKYPEEFSK